MTNGADRTDMASTNRISAEDACGLLPADNISPAKLEELRNRILQGVCGGDISAASRLMPAYGAMLQSLAEGASASGRLRELESHHVAFFEQLRTLLIASRIETRRELERVRASRQYSAYPAEAALAETWRG